MDLTNAFASVQGIIQNTFGKSGITYLPKGGTAITITGVFDERPYQVDVGQVVPVSTVRPTLFVRLSDLPGKPGSGDVVTVDAVQYRVADCQEDGEGGALLILGKL